MTPGLNMMSFNGSNTGLGSVIMMGSPMATQGAQNTQQSGMFIGFINPQQLSQQIQQQQQMQKQQQIQQQQQQQKQNIIMQFILSLINFILNLLKGNNTAESQGKCNCSNSGCNSGNSNNNINPIANALSSAVSNSQSNPNAALTALTVLFGIVSAMLLGQNNNFGQNPDNSAQNGQPCTMILISA